MRADDWRIFKYGGRYKLVYYKTGRNPIAHKKSPQDVLADFYEENLTGRVPFELWEKYEQGYYASKERAKKREKEQPKGGSEEERLRSSISRAKARVNELALCNEFEYFCTFTQSDELRNRFDLKAFRKDFAMFVRNENRRREKKIKYLLVPERHKDGAWHMHGLLMGLTSDDLYPNEYGYLDWARYRRKFGFFSCSRIFDREATASYVTKYISKDMATENREAFGHLFFASQGLKGREVVPWDYLQRCPKTDFGFENEYVKVLWADSLEEIVS